MNITDNLLLLKRYDILELMVAQTTVDEINKNIEPYVNRWIKNIENVKSIRVHIWVNSMFHDILTACKNESRDTYKDFFKYQLNFEINKKMKQNEYKFYGVALITEDKCTGKNKKQTR